jgi:hypothetical protein
MQAFDVAVKRHYDTDQQAKLLGVYALNYTHAICIARELLDVRGPMVYVRDVAADQVKYIDQEWQPCSKS